MRSEKPKKKEPWQIVVGILSLMVIVFLWVKKDIAAIYSTMPAEQVLPLIVTTVAVSLIKVGIIVGVVFLIKWIAGKVGKK